MVQTALVDEYFYTEADCCGNGCANCVLNTKPTKSKCSKTTGKHNIINNYVKFQLIGKKKHSMALNNILELHFAYLVENKTADVVLDVPAGHHIMMRAPNVQQAETDFVLRPYSPYWIDELKLEFKICVNLKPQGPMSFYIDTLQLNDEVEFRGPIGNFTHHVSETNDNTLIIITQGVAIAPAIRIIEEILYNEEDMCRIVHLACFSDFHSIYFRNKLLDFTHYWNYKNRIYLTHEVCENIKCITLGTCTADCENFRKRVRYKENILTQRLDKYELEEVCRQLKGKNNLKLAVSGNINFQNYVAKTMNELELNTKSFEIYLL